ncbi:MAG: DUF1353 domain-containing protein [Flavobacteriales bacterium]
MQINPTDNYPVEIILPNEWYHQARYRIRQPIQIGDVKIPEGFVTDGATVPLLFRWAFPPMGRYFPAAMAHDYLLSQGNDWATSNAVFRKVLKHCGIPTWQRVLMGWATSLYGTYKEFVKKLKQTSWYV